MIQELINFQTTLMVGPRSAAAFAFVLFAALCLGSIIGVERELHNRSAGIRTNALVCVGTAIFVSIAFYLPPPFEAARIIAQVVSGIGFLGAGLIWRNGSSVSGLDTAATVWCTAAVGAFAGAGCIIEASIGACGVLVLNIALRKLTHRFFKLGKASSTSHTRFDIWLDPQCDERKRVACQVIARALNSTKQFNWVGSNIDWNTNENRTTIHFTFVCIKGVESINEWLEQFQNAAPIIHWTWHEEPQQG